MKYIGSKAKLAKQIVPILQKLIEKNNIKVYYEPFVGGFNVIDKIVCKYKLANDIDKLVIDLVTFAREKPNMIEMLELPSKEQYYDVRDNGYKYQDWYRAAILLFASYNARVYGGCYGAIATTKQGTTRNYFLESKNNFIKQLPNLNNIRVSCASYEKIDLTNKQHFLIYCDPPYAEGVGYSNKFDSNAFWQWCRDQVKKGHIVVVSEINAPDDFNCIWEQKITTHLNNRNKIEKIEKLFMLGGAYA